MLLYCAMYWMDQRLKHLGGRVFIFLRKRFQIFLSSSILPPSLKTVCSLLELRKKPKKNKAIFLLVLDKIVFTVLWNMFFFKRTLLDHQENFMYKTCGLYGLQTMSGCGIYFGNSNSISSPIPWTYNNRTQRGWRVGRGWEGRGKQKRLAVIFSAQAGHVRRAYGDKNMISVGMRVSQSVIG